MPDTANFIVAVVTVVVNVFVLGCGGVWVISKIRTEVAVLNETLKNLSKLVSRLNDRMDEVSGEVTEQGKELAIVKDRRNRHRTE